MWEVLGKHIDPFRIYRLRVNLKKPRPKYTKATLTLTRETHISAPKRRKHYMWTSAYAQFWSYWIIFTFIYLFIFLTQLCTKLNLNPNRKPYNAT